MQKPIQDFRRLVNQALPQSVLKIDAPSQAGGSWWLDVSVGRKHYTLEYRPGKGFGLFYKDNGYGEGPAEIYRTPERVATRLRHLIAAPTGKRSRLDLKGIRQLY